jgi:hypothetical protein
LTRRTNEALNTLATIMSALDLELGASVQGRFCGDGQRSAFVMNRCIRQASDRGPPSAGQFLYYAVEPYMARQTV